jgi:hypothetical protein
MEEVRPPTPSERTEQLLTEERATARERRRDYLVAR